MAEGFNIIIYILFAHMVFLPMLLKKHAAVLVDDLQINLVKGNMELAIAMFIINQGQYSTILTLFVFLGIYDITKQLYINEITKFANDFW